MEEEGGECELKTKINILINLLGLFFGLQQTSTIWACEIIMGQIKAIL